MRKIIQSINITQDGSCDHTAVIADDELHENAIELMQSADTLLMGRVTYQLMENSWPEVARKRTDPAPMVEFADLIDKIDKIVYSRTLPGVQWKNTTLVPELGREEILRLKEQPGKNILAGGLSLAALLTQMGLIDEYYFLVQPMIAGNIRPFLGKTRLDKPLMLKFMDSKTFRSGVTLLRYRV